MRALILIVVFLAGCASNHYVCEVEIERSETARMRCSNESDVQLAALPVS